MSITNDGGPVFPIHGSMGEVVHPGASLRDFFAAHAMQAFIISEVMEAFRRNDYAGRQDHGTYIPALGFAELAELAGRQADAMIAERDRTRPPTA